MCNNTKSYTYVCVQHIRKTFTECDISQKYARLPTSRDPWSPVAAKA